MAPCSHAAISNHDKRQTEDVSCQLGQASSLRVMDLKNNTEALKQKPQALVPFPCDAPRWSL